MEFFSRESRAISRILDRIGYSSQLVTFRQKVYKKIGQTLNNHLTEAHMSEYLVIAGSKAEGITSPCENDQDFMKVQIDVTCSEYPGSLRNSDNKIVFVLDTRCTNPGYTFLRLEHFNENLPVSNMVRDCLVEFLPGQIYLSSDIWKKYIKACMSSTYSERDNLGIFSTQQETHGPSCTVSFLNSHDADVVHALECDCSIYLNSWITRNRSYQWPPVHVIWDVYISKAHVVPVGFPENPTYFLEWRICFTEGEIKLVQSLNDCLTKVLILLKQIVRATLMELCRNMTSYIIKNVVFWIAEMHDNNIFTENNLLCVLHLALRFLKRCILTGNLPSYMIPERNLIAVMTDRQRLDLCMRIDSLEGQGPQIVLNSPKMVTAITMRYHNPEEFKDFYRRHQEAELFALARDCYCFLNIWRPDNTVEQSIHNSLTDDVFKYLHFRFLSACFDGLEEEAFDISPEEVDEMINVMKNMTNYDLYSTFMTVLTQYLC